jgi:hypothetical protein
MKKILLALAFIAGTLIASAQQPGFQWAKSLGSTGQESPSRITTDANGNVYTIGSFYGSTDLDPGPATANFTCLGLSDIFISKLDASGNFLWAKQIGGATDEIAFGIAVDAAGNVYSTGWFDGTTDFDPGVTTYTLAASLRDQFILKLDPSGNFIWAKQLGAATASVQPTSMALDNAGNVYTCGNFYGTADFDPGIATYTLISNGTSDVFISKIDATGNFVWANSFGSVGNDFVRSLALDPFGTIYTIGTFDANIDFDPSINTYTLDPIGGTDMFVSVIDGSGNFIFAKQFGDITGSVFPQSIAIDSQNNIYASGFFGGTFDFDPSVTVAAYLNAVGNSDVFILKLNPGGQYIWANSIGGANGSCFAPSIKADALFNVYIAGYYTALTDFDPGAATNNISVSGTHDAYLLKLDPLGNFTWVKRFGGNGLDVGIALTLDQASNIYLVGWYEQSADFDPTVGISTLTSAGNTDVFIVKLNQSLTTLNENKLTTALSIFPNPASNVLNINSDVIFNDLLKIEIYNSLGQLILKDQITSQKLSINIADLSAGIYILNVMNNKETFSKKIVKQ